jgi:hypothetical protein
MDEQNSEESECDNFESNANLEHKSTITYRPELDGLRAVAVIAVICY